VWFIQSLVLQVFIASKLLCRAVKNALAPVTHPVTKREKIKAAASNGDLFLIVFKRRFSHLRFF
jgi:hypothetical protein